MRRKACSLLAALLLLMGCASGSISKEPTRYEASFLSLFDTVTTMVGYADSEEAFRATETAALEALGKQSARVISTGGGCVTRQRNYPLLHQNGYLVWLERDLTLLPTDGRPLSQSTALTDMYKVRKPMYEAFADIRVENSGAPEDTVRESLERLEELP